MRNRLINSVYIYVKLMILSCKALITNFESQCIYTRDASITNIHTYNTRYDVANYNQQTPKLIYMPFVKHIHNKSFTH